MKCDANAVQYACISFGKNTEVVIMGNDGSVHGALPLREKKDSFNLCRCARVCRWPEETKLSQLRPEGRLASSWRDHGALCLCRQLVRGEAYLTVPSEEDYAACRRKTDSAPSESSARPSMTPSGCHRTQKIDCTCHEENTRTKEESYCVRSVKFELYLPTSAAEASSSRECQASAAETELTLTWGSTPDWPEHLHAWAAR